MSKTDYSIKKPHSTQLLNKQFFLMKSGLCSFLASKNSLNPSFYKPDFLNEIRIVQFYSIQKTYSRVVGAEYVEVSDVEGHVGRVLLGQRLPPSQRPPVDRTLRTFLAALYSSECQRVPLIFPKFGKISSHYHFFKCH